MHTALIASGNDDGSIMRTELSFGAGFSVPSNSKHLPKFPSNRRQITRSTTIAFCGTDCAVLAREPKRNQIFTELRSSSLLFFSMTRKIKSVVLYMIDAHFWHLANNNDFHFVLSFKLFDPWLCTLVLGDEHVQQ